MIVVEADESGAVTTGATDGPRADVDEEGIIDEDEARMGDEF